MTLNYYAIVNQTLSNLHYEIVRLVRFDFIDTGKSILAGQTEQC